MNNYPAVFITSVLAMNTFVKHLSHLLFGTEGKSVYLIGQILYQGIQHQGPFAYRQNSVNCGAPLCLRCIFDEAEAELKRLVLEMGHWMISKDIEQTSSPVVVTLQGGICSAIW